MYFYSTRVVKDSRDRLKTNEQLFGYAVSEGIEGFAEYQEKMEQANELYDQVYRMLTFEGTTHVNPVSLRPEMRSGDCATMRS